MIVQHIYTGNWVLDFIKIAGVLQEILQKKNILVSFRLDTLYFWLDIARPSGRIQSLSVKYSLSVKHET